MREHVGREESRERVLEGWIKVFWPTASARVPAMWSEALLPRSTHASGGQKGNGPINK